MFESNTYFAVAIFQGVLDTVNIFFIAAIVQKLGGDQRAALLGGLFYSLYPFSLIWVPVTGTESLGIFCTLLFFYCLAQERYHANWWYILLGILCAIAFYVREYLGIFFPITLFCFFYYCKQSKIQPMQAGLFVITFVILYGLWPLRNYLFHQRIEFLKPDSAGYVHFGKDFSSFRNWMYTWNSDVQPYFGHLLKEGNPQLPDVIFQSPEEKLWVNQLLDTALNCGASFYAWRDLHAPPQTCDDYISQQFDSLRKVYINRYPFRYYIQVPLSNFKKALFRSQVIKSPKHEVSTTLIRMAFLGRSMLVILGFFGLLSLRRCIPGMAIGGFCVFMYLFICIFVRQVEMRYLVQADVVLLISASIVTARLLFKPLTSEFNKEAGRYSST
jgi:4-amino-4-deoxy-L-arabinose transferase-like glycosyltransferase